MENRHQKDREWERLLRESLSEEKPEKQEMIVQNNLLRARMEQKKQRRSIPLWYLPRVLHALILLLAALVICLLVQNPLLELLAAVTATGGSSSRFTLEDPQRQQLAVDLQFEQGEWMRMQITQQTRDGRTLERESRVTSDENTQYFSLEGFEEGTIKVRFYNNGVSGVKAQVRVA